MNCAGRFWRRFIRRFLLLCRSGLLPLMSPAPASSLQIMLVLLDLLLRHALLRCSHRHAMVPQLWLQQGVSAVMRAFS